MTGRRWLLVSGLAVLATTFIGPHIVPLYDGVGFPDQPYQFIGRSGQTSQTPSPVEQTVPKSDLSKYGTTLQSLESGPQIRVIFGPGAITLPGAATDIKLSAVPEAASSLPSAGTIASNIYIISGNSQPGPPTVRDDLANIFLRLPQGVSFRTAPVIIYRPSGGKWKQLGTAQTGTDIYVAPFSGWGDYAIAINLPTPPSPGANSTNSSSHNDVLLLCVVFIGIIAASFAAIRFMGSPKHAPRKNK